MSSLSIINFIIYEFIYIDDKPLMVRFIYGMLLKALTNKIVNFTTLCFSEKAIV